MRCPTCGAPSDAFQRTNGGAPADLPVVGAVLVCGYCVGLAIVTVDGELRAPDLSERGDLLGRIDVLEAMAALLTAPSIGSAVESARRIHHAVRS